MPSNFGIKQKIGALLFDVPGYLFAFIKSTLLKNRQWLYIRNRDETLKRSDSSMGVKCAWKWTSTLYLPKVYPWFGKRLFALAIEEFPITLKHSPEETSQSTDVSFIIGHRGLERLPLLLKTLESIAGQRKCKIECIVVEQDSKPLIQSQLPVWVNYIFSQVKDKNAPYSRSSAFNVGVQHASSALLIFHDNDLLVPACYAKQHLNKFEQGFEFINLKRFIFYFDQTTSAAQLTSPVVETSPTLDAVMQNAEGGGSIAASKEAYLMIGGFDNRFVGWGSEDNEFWERAQTKLSWEYGYLPLVHLWHAPQAEKVDSDNSTTKALYQRLSLITPEQRIKNLLSDKHHE